MGKPVRVLVYGLFPTVYSMCAPCCTRDYLAMCRPGYQAEQLAEYPEGLRRNQRLLELLAFRLGSIRGVRVEAVSADSLKGLLLAARYRLGRGPAVIVEGRVFKEEELDFRRIVEYVESLVLEKVWGARATGP